MEVKQFDTKILKAGDIVPMITQWDLSKSWYCYGTIEMVTQSGYMVSTEENIGFSVVMAYSHEGVLLGMNPLKVGELTMQWWVMEPTKENIGLVEKSKALEAIKMVKFEDLPIELLLEIEEKLKSHGAVSTGIRRNLELTKHE